MQMRISRLCLNSPFHACNLSYANENKFPILKQHLLTRVYTWMCLHHKTCEEWTRFEILFFYILHISIDLNLLDKLNMYQTISLYGN